MHMSRCARRRGPLTILLLATLGLLAGCDGAAQGKSTVQAQTTRTHPIGTATLVPHLVVPFACAAGSLPVGPSFIQTSCSVETTSGASVLRAQLTSSTTPSLYLDEPALNAKGWQQLSAAHGDGAVTSSGWALWVNQAAWFDYNWTGSENSATISITASVPLSPTIVPCGNSVAASGQMRLGIPLPLSIFSSGENGFILVPACLQDVEQFYATAPGATGWTARTSFGPPPGSVGDGYVVGRFTKDAAAVSVWLGGLPGTVTMVSVAQTNY